MDQVWDGASDRGLDQLHLLAVVNLVRAGCRAGAGVAADINKCPTEGMEAGLHKRPSTHVHRLFLHPDPFRRPPIPVEGTTEFLGCKWVELLQTQNGDLSRFLLC